MKLWKKFWHWEWGPWTLAMLLVLATIYFLGKEAYNIVGGWR